MATPALLRALRRRADLPSASLSAYRSLTSSSKPVWNPSSPPLYQTWVRSSRPFSSAAAGAKKSSLQPGTLQTTIAKLKASIAGDNSVKEIMADYGPYGCLAVPLPLMLGINLATIAGSMSMLFFGFLVVFVHKLWSLGYELVAVIYSAPELNLN